jgi:hypothetical protein
MTQPELPFDPPVDPPHYDHYTVTLARGPMHDELVIRQHQAKSRDAAENLIGGLRDTYNARERVAWQSEEVNADGALYGLAPGGVVYVIRVTPALSVALAS